MAKLKFGVLEMLPTLIVFDRSPDGGRGLARDTRVRWAFEEVGQPYQVRPVSFSDMKQSSYKTQHPFGQIPVYEAGEMVLFESGSIVLHIAETHAGLLPKDPNARSRAITWMFAAVSTIEPPILELQTAKLAEGDQPWTKERLPLIRQRICKCLENLTHHLGNSQWLDGEFTAGDLMVVSVLQRLRPSGILADFETISAYIDRAEARPAFQRAFEAQRAFNRRV